MTIPDLSSRALAARTALLALCDALVSAADASHAGIAVPPPAPTPAPEAKRPTHVRITDSASPSRFKDGDVLRVVKWIADVPAVDVDGYDVAGYVLYDSKWEPAPCPPPVAGSAEDVAVRDAEARVIAAAIAWNAKYNSDEVKYPEGAHSERLDLHDAVTALAEARAALSRPVRP